MLLIRNDGDAHKTFILNEIEFFFSSSSSSRCREKERERERLTMQAIYISSHWMSVELESKYHYREEQRKIDDFWTESGKKNREENERVIIRCKWGSDGNEKKMKKKKNTHQTTFKDTKYWLVSVCKSENEVLGLGGY